MVFVLVNKIVVAGLIFALIIYLFVKKKRADMVFTLSIIVLTFWLINLVTDGYFRINFARLGFYEIERISGLDGLSLGMMLIFLFFLSFSVMRRALKDAGRKYEKELRLRHKIKKKEKN